MQAAEIIHQAVISGRSSLTEAESKAILKTYCVPVVEETVASTAEEAVQRAAAMGYPLVLKGLGARLTHKTERGLVWLNLKNSNELISAANYIKEAAGQDLEGFLLQPMLAGKREFVAGLFYDKQFGPTIMFGLGGIFTEAIGDVVFRLAPLSENEAEKMINEITANKLLDNFRGEKAPDKAALIKTLLGLSRISSEIPEIREIDINPLLVSADGRVTAVDALIITGRPAENAVTSIPVEPKLIGKLFYPKSIAFIGASAEFGKWGHLLFTNVVAGKFGGDIFLVNAKGGKIAGRKVYQTVTDIPEPVDLAVISVPAAIVQDILPQLAQKSIRNVLLITSGFAEVGADGKSLENKLIEDARRRGIMILGPNTMGICNPHISLYCTGTHVRPEPGGTVLVAQSGNLGTQLLAFAEKEGIGIRAFCGSGNEAMITIEDYLEGFAVDEITKTVVLYIESIKEGRRFFTSAKRVGKQKPVIALKGGRTQAGEHAAASHTGAMASNVKVFDAACRQAGVVLVEHPMDLLDLSAAFSSLPLPQGKRIGLMTLGGGWGVVASDLCTDYGLTVPQLSDELIARISKLLPPFWSHANPVDVVAEMKTEIHMAIIEELLQWQECDAVIHMGIVGRRIMIKQLLESAVAVDKSYDRKFLEATLGALEAFEQQLIERTARLMEKYKKPVVGVYLLHDDRARTVTEVSNCLFKGITFTSPERAVKSLAKMYAYSKWLSESAEK